MGRVRLDTFVVLQFLSCVHVLCDRVAILLPEGAARANISGAGLSALSLQNFSFLKKIVNLTLMSTFKPVSLRG